MEALGITQTPASPVSNQTQAHRSTQQRLSILLLPDELLVMIFQECRTCKVWSRNMHEAPFMLARVCSRFRALVFSTPHLWSMHEFFLGLPRYPSHPLDCKTRTRLLQFWLERSVPCPLRFSLIVEVNQYSDAANQYSDAAKGIFEVLLMHVNRWQDVTLFLPWHDMSLEHDISFFSRFEPSNPRFPQLRSLELVELDGPQAEAWISNVFKSAPMLKSLSYSDCRPRWKDADQVFWRQVEKLEIGIYSLVSLPQVLGMAPNLTVLKAAVFYESLPPTRPVVIHHLKELSLEDGKDISAAFDFIQLPEVVKILIYCRFPSNFTATPPLPYQSIRSFLSRSSCKLRSLHLDRVSMEKGKFAELLKHPSISRSLESLTLQFTRGMFDDDAGHVLGSVGYLTHLFSLCLDHCVESSDGLLAEAIELRCFGISARLLRVEVAVPVDHIKDIQEISALQELSKQQIGGPTIDFRLEKERFETAGLFDF